MARDKSQPNPLEYELLAEKAASLGRVAKKMEEVLCALRTLDQELAATKTPTTEQRARRMSLLEDAAEQVWFYVVQREAMGIREHKTAFELYQVPGEVQRRMGPRRRS